MNEGLLEWFTDLWTRINDVPANDWPWIVAAVVVLLYLGRSKKKRRK